jgi:integrase
MAWLEERSGLYRITFRYGGRKLHHSLKTQNRKEAESCLSRLEENLRLLERGRLEIPPGAELALFLISDGKLNEKPVIEKPLSLDEFFRGYREKLPEGTKEPNTRYTEDIHIEHLLRLIGPGMSIRGITTETLQNYVDTRGLETGRRGNPLSHATIKKEIGTLSSIWNKWALPRRLVTGPAPSRGLIYRKGKGKPPFQTIKQIEQVLKRGGLSEEEKKDLWDSLFLTLSEIEDVLGHVKESCRHPAIYAMFAFAAHTGARRSEILRSRVDDFDFGRNTVTIREKKKDRSKEFTFRSVPISIFLRDVMTDWFKSHPGGQLTICQEADKPLTVQVASHHFRWALEESRWEKLRGWHVFRHSFASNCAAKGLDQRLIDEWMGHQTEEMRRRYRHLFPDQQRQAILSVFGGKRISSVAKRKAV